MEKQFKVGTPVKMILPFLKSGEGGLGYITHVYKDDSVKIYWLVRPSYLDGFIFIDVVSPHEISVAFEE